MKTLRDILNLAYVLDEPELNRRIFEWIRNGELDEATFVEYQETTQADIVDCLAESLNG